MQEKFIKILSRTNNPFIVLNGSLLTEEKFENELFGEEYSRWHLFLLEFLEKAHKGTLLIDEVSEIPIRDSSAYITSFDRSKIQKS